MGAGRLAAAAAAMASVASGVVLLPASPAGASIATSASGTIVTVTVAGDESVSFDCSGSGTVRVNFTEVSPATACATLTQVTVNGDGGVQNVYGSGLASAAFAATPRLTVSLGDGRDLLYETTAADQIDMGGGDDEVRLQSLGPNNAFVSMGAGTGDRLVFETAAGADVVTVTSSSGSVTIGLAGATTTTRTASGAERLSVSTNSGDDVVDTTGLLASSSIDFLSVEGGAGDDELRDGPVGSTLYGGDGTNVIEGGAGGDAYWSSSPTDTLTDANDGLVDFVYDERSRRGGGRTLAGFGPQDYFYFQAHESDTVVRIRPGAGGSAVLTASLNRTGQQVVPAGLGSINPSLSYVGALSHRAVVDVVAVDQAVGPFFPDPGTGLLDVTIPSGTWTVSGVASAPTITSDHGAITSGNVDDFRVHGPWTDRNRGFAHRATRDLLLRFASDGELATLDAALDAGTRTRAQVTASLMGTAEYRGLDVDRVFQRYLRRNPDPGGRTYWINSLGAGKALWRFRAQLFGSNEYFTKAGGTNATYVQRAYADVLGRAPDPSGATYWTNKLNAGADRGQVALQFMNSAEARRRLVDDQFLRFLDRPPTSTEQTTWVAALPSDDGEQRMIAFLVNSATYFNRS